MNFVICIFVYFFVNLECFKLGKEEINEILIMEIKILKLVMANT